MNKKERKKENKDLEQVPFVMVQQTDRNTPPHRGIAALLLEWSPGQLRKSKEPP
jgi:hypothetical protein